MDKKYWKYVKKTDIYNNIITEKMTKEEESKKYYLPETIIKLANSKTNRKILKVYLKNKDEIDFILCQGYFVEDISEDKDFIFNKMKNVKHVNNYKFGYTKEILSEIDFILNHINNNDTILKKYDINKLVKYEVPFTRVNSLYKQDSDNYIKKYFKSILEYLDILCKELDNFFELKNKNSINDSILQKLIKYYRCMNITTKELPLTLMKDLTNAYNQIILNNNIIKKLHTKIYKDKYNDIDYDLNHEILSWNVIKNINIIRMLSMMAKVFTANLIYDSERSTPILLSESDNSSYNESNSF
ncbi:hypothetical protein LY90DRAFT_678436 [Neocallimastix californiae]|uniref:Uncharacterized protein n=1 Tax=Neocallimastix californiae TaxID=1754190 RepID=A0A1Y1Z6G7_9FUNG|nr:hypothetical protein LY90DRAFT_678436 [Neocallimastix californiae]|eukprot:ORY05587.1 hypothetical protein LY90DRAFT_678436 [Neocallimastix californiae]